MQMNVLEAKTSFSRLLRLLESGKLDLSPMITDRFPFDRVKEAFDAVTARNDTRIKVMVDFE